MSISRPFVYRRIGTCLLALGMVLIGVVAYRGLPVSSLPEVDFPTIQVTANLPGASAQTMATSVATPLERAFSNIPNVTQMTSSSSLGLTTIVLQFSLNRNIDGAAQDVQTEIQAAAGLLPKDMPSPPTFSKVNPANASIISLALTSPTLPLTELDQYAENYLAQPISQLPGVGMIDYHGQLRPAVRLRIDPEKLAGLGLTLDDVRKAIGGATLDAPKGTLNGPNQSVVLNTTDQLLTAAAYRDMVVAYRNNAPIRLADIGTVVDAPEDVYEGAWLNGQRAIILDVAQQPGSNVVKTIQNIKRKIPELPGRAACRGRTASGGRSHADHSCLGQRRADDDADLHRPRGDGDLRLPAQCLGDADPEPDHSAVPDRDLRGHVSPGLQPRQPVPDGPDHRGRLRRRRRNRGDRERHRGIGRREIEAAAGRTDGAREVGFTIVSMTVSLIAVFIPILLDERNRRAPVPRIRRHHQRRAHHVGHRLADA